jgi:hypothetical protein
MSKRELFRTLVASHYRDLLGFIVYCLRRRNFRPQTAVQMAEDVAAEVILLAWRKQDDFVRSEGLHEGDLAVQFRGWLHSIARNKISEAIRRTACEQRHYFGNVATRPITWAGGGGLQSPYGAWRLSGRRRCGRFACRGLVRPVSCHPMPDDSTPKGLHPFWDRAIRFLLQRPAHLAAIIRLSRPDLADRMDFEHLERIDRSFVLEDYQQRAADVVARLPFRGEREAREVLVYLLLEHQSTVDAWMPFRVLFYMVRLWEDQRRAAEAEGNKAGLAPIIPVVFYTGSRGWTAGHRLEDLVKGATELLPFCPRFDIMHIGLPETSPAALESIGPVGWALRAVQRVNVSRPEFGDVLRRAADVIGRLFGEEGWELLSFLLLLVAYRRPGAEFREWADVLEGAVENTRWRMELETMGKSILQEKFEEGELEGELRGELKGRFATVLHLGRKRFGEPTPEQRSRLEAIDSPERFEALSGAILDAASWDELLRNA